MFALHLLSCPKHMVYKSLPKVENMWSQIPKSLVDLNVANIKVMEYWAKPHMNLVHILISKLNEKNLCNETDLKFFDILQKAFLKHQQNDIDITSDYIKD